jgi:hypothetical protein
MGSLGSPSAETWRWCPLVPRRRKNQKEEEERVLKLPFCQDLAKVPLKQQIFFEKTGSKLLLC